MKNLLIGLCFAAAAALSSFARTSPKWVTDGIVYQIQPRTFTAEATLAAATKKLPELKDLGVTIVYMTPVFVMDTDENRAHWSKRQTEAGVAKNPYRIADYNHVDPEFGTDADLVAFTAEAHRLGARARGALPRERGRASRRGRRRAGARPLPRERAVGGRSLLRSRLARAGIRKDGTGDAAPIRQTAMSRGNRRGCHPLGAVCDI